MTKVRLYELAKDVGVDVTVMVTKCEELGITVDGHLAPLSEADAVKLRKALAVGAGGRVQEKRVRKTVIRRRRRGGKETDVSAAEEAAPAAASEAPPAAAAKDASAAEEPAAAADAVESGEAPSEAEASPAGEPAPDEAPADSGDDSDENSPRTDTKWGAHEVSRRGERDEPEGSSRVQVVRRLDPAQTESILATQRRQSQGPPPRRAPSGPRGPGGGPGGPRGAPLGGPSMPLGPAPGKVDTRRKPRKGGRVAYDRQKDRNFDGHRGNRRMRPKKNRRGAAPVENMAAPTKASKRVIKMDETISVGELASQLSVKASEIIMYLMQQGEMVTVNNVLDLDTVTLIAQEYGFTVESVSFDIENFIQKPAEEAELTGRDPVVTVMGHVDHGKTSLLDHIRTARVAAGEAGGITQHIGAYKVPVSMGDIERSVVFLDTPGHAAFTEMRARGAQVTDITILVVAADDGVMPQTIEAINHSKAAEVPIVVAVNKCDKEDANPERVRRELSEHGVVTEEWGGDTQFFDVSAITGDGVEELLSGICLLADVLELEAVADGPAQGVVIEAELSRGRGPVATVLVQQGTLKKGDIVVSGKASGRVRALVDDRGQQAESVGPSTPVEVLGLSEVPPPSELVYVVKDEKDARQIVSHLEDKVRQKRLAEERKKVSLDDLFDHLDAGEVTQLSLIVKSDVKGSLEALRTAFGKLKHPEIKVQVIHDGVGPVSESDVGLASASNAVVIGFNVRPEKKAKDLADRDGVQIKTYSIIYEVIDEVKLAMEGLLSPDVEERALGRAEVRETFNIPKRGTIAGCAVLQGKVARDALARLVRDGRVVYTGKVGNLRRFKDNVNEVDRGHECGIKLENYNDVKIGDEIECYEMVEVQKKLELEEE